MKKHPVKLLTVFVLLFLATLVFLVAFFHRSSSLNLANNSSFPQNTPETVSDIAKSPLSSLRKKDFVNENPLVKKKDLEDFDQQTGLKPLTDEEMERLTGEELEKRVIKLESALISTAERNPDLSAPPDWFVREHEILANRHFAETKPDKVVYHEEKEEDLQHKRERYLSVLKNKGNKTEKELEEIKEKIFNEESSSR